MDRVVGGLVVIWVLGLCGCESGEVVSGSAPLRPDPGLVFTYPRDGQHDVPLRAQVVVTWSDETATAPTVRLESASGPLSATTESSGRSQLLTADFEENATYRILVDDVVRATFHTRSPRPIPGEAPVLVTLNEATPEEALVLDVGSLRLLFSEPLDPASVHGGTVRLLDASGEAVAGSLVTQGSHVTFSPHGQLAGQGAYQLELTAGLADEGGEAIAPLTLPLEPQVTVQGYEQVLTLNPTAAEGAAPPLSPLSSLSVNSVSLSSALVGSNPLGIQPGSLTAQLWDPVAFGGALPLTIKRGQRLDIDSLDVKLGGQVPQGVATGTLHFTLLTDAFGILRRSPYREAEQLPDDARAPVFVDVVMDAVVTSEDLQGNVIATQNILGIQLLGTARVVEDYLQLDLVGALDYDLLGVNIAQTQVALRMRSGLPSQAPGPLPLPEIYSSYPEQGASDFEPDQILEINYTGPLDPASLGQISLTHGQDTVPVTSWLSGSALLVKPLARLQDGVAGVLQLSGLKSLAGDDLEPASIDFATPERSAGAVDAPPVVLGLIPGAPCATTGALATAPGACAGGLFDDASYQPFSLPANHALQVWFSQPMSTESYSVAQECGQGSLRLEQVDAVGQCLGVVQGTLYAQERQLRFVPGSDLEVGGTYRLTLVAGDDTACDAGELCSLAGAPLNSDPLRGMGADQAGGPDIMVSFTATEATSGSFQALASNPQSDLNSNGYLDPAEAMTDGNRVAYEVSDVGGVITEASLNGEDCMPEREGQQVCVAVHATLPVDIQQLLETCPIDLQGEASTAAAPCMQTHLYPSTLLFSSLSMNTTALGLLPVDDLETGTVFIRIQELEGASYGYIMEDPEMPVPQYVINNDVYIDAPDLQILDGLVTHDLQSKALRTTLRGPVTFRPDGRMDVALRNVTDLTITINVEALGLPGYVELRIPEGAMAVTLGGPLLR